MRRLLGSALAVVAVACTSKGGGGGGATTMTRDQLLDPTTCKQCHANHYQEWSGSMHAYASDDPVFLAMNKRGQRETNGALGSFCVNCHAPMAVREGATKDGQNLATVPGKLKGVTCFFCHTIDAVTGSHNALLDLAADGTTMLGPFHDPVANAAHHATYSALHDRDTLESASMCGTCHDIVNGHGVALERTFAEWQASVFAKPPGGTTCGQCHMAQSANLEPIAQAPNVFSRRRHAHTFQGVDVALTPFPETDAQKTAVQAFLNSALQSAVCVSSVAGTQIRVMIDNVAGGHGLPSGAGQDRRAWIEVAAYANNAVIYSSGTVADGTAITTSTDPDLWLLRDCIFGDKGTEVHMFWEATSNEGNALPAQTTFNPTDPAYYQTHIERVFPRSSPATGTADRVTLRVRLQPMGLDVLDDLIASGDLDRSLRGAMPTFDVGAVLEWTPQTATTDLLVDRVPYKCITKTNFNVVADRFPAKEHTRCKP
jgi:hypothetical protein